MSQSNCMVIRKGGVLFCEAHGCRLVDRRTFDSLNVRLENPPVGDDICPISGKSFRSADDVIEVFEE